VGLYKRWVLPFLGGQPPISIAASFSLWCVTDIHALISFFFFFSSASSSSPDPNLNLNPKPTSSSSSHPPPSSQQIQTSNIKPHQAHIIQPTFSPAVNERVENTVDGCVRDAVGQSGRYYCRKEGAGVMRGIQLRFEEGCCGHGMC